MGQSRRWLILLGMSLLVGRPLACRAAEDLQSKDCGWCVITCPRSVATGEPFEIQILLKGLTGMAKLSADLHYTKKDGAFGGMLAWGGEGRDVAQDGPQAIRFTIGERKEDLGAVHVYTFLSPDGDWNKRTKEASGPNMQVRVTAAFLKTREFGIRTGSGIG